MKEKFLDKLLNRYAPASIFLTLTGIATCQLAELPVWGAERSAERPAICGLQDLPGEGVEAKAVGEHKVIFYGDSAYTSIREREHFLPEGKLLTLQLDNGTMTYTINRKRHETGNKYGITTVKICDKTAREGLFTDGVFCNGEEDIFSIVSADRYEGSVIGRAAPMFCDALRSIAERESRLRVENAEERLDRVDRILGTQISNPDVEETDLNAAIDYSPKRIEGSKTEVPQVFRHTWHSKNQVIEVAW